MQISSFFTVLSALLVVSAGTHHSGLKQRHSKRVKLLEDRDENVNVAARSNTTLVPRDTFTGSGTYFYVGLGACGQYSQDSDLMVALNYQQYGSGYPGPECFKYITIQANGVTVGGVEILDECPSCPDWGDLDMSPGLFQRFADLSVGEIPITWWFDDSSSSSSSSTSQWQQTSTSTWQAPTSTSTWQAPTSTSTWQAPTSTSTWVAPSSTSTWVAPSSTSTWVAPSSSSTVLSSRSSSIPSSTFTSSSTSTSASASASVSASISLNATVALNTTNPFAIVSSKNATAIIAGASASASASSSSSGSFGSGSSSTGSSGNNLVNLNALTAQYGQLVVVAASS